MRTNYAQQITKMLLIAVLAAVLAISLPVQTAQAAPQIDLPQAVDTNGDPNIFETTLTAEEAVVDQCMGEEGIGQSQRVHQILVQRPFKKTGIQYDSNKPGHTCCQSPEEQFKSQCLPPFPYYVPLLISQLLAEKRLRRDTIFLICILFSVKSCLYREKPPAWQ